MFRINEYESRFTFRRDRSAVVIWDTFATPGGNYFIYSFFGSLGTTLKKSKNNNQTAPRKILRIESTARTFYGYRYETARVYYYTYNI
jgi:hypothetical protein